MTNSFADGRLPLDEIGAANGRPYPVERADVPGTDRIVTLVATVRVLARGTEEYTDEALGRLSLRVQELLREEGVELIGCDWTPDADTIADNVDFPDGTSSRSRCSTSTRRARADG